MLKLNIKKYIIIATVILLLIFLHYVKLLRPIESFLNQHLKPIFSSFYSLSANINKTYLTETQKQDLAAELKQAEEKINQLIAENVKLRFLEEENLVLRKHLNFFNKDNRRYLMSNIISRGELIGASSQGNQSVLIDKGWADGLFAGMAAISSTAYGTSSQGVIIGKIVNVKEHIAEVYLVTNKNCKLAASIFGENKTSGIASGELDLTVKMNFIPQTENIKAGDVVATSGLEQNIPQGLIIGRVTKVNKENNEVWQTATIEPMVDLDTLSIVSILLP
ncbi:rod shape-determining protein MreC [Patescibacteria group bacterium]|nr:rod shape-determining protein MreC [Patescibacteria group bacterium]MBU1663036.1 rod shape-determining protein MreC [Patescibacteria group bacterium]MBU1934124.1 rod shape-determining protein MreC [Patescibacteria group bacterium]MBU2007907.1 rod shape-determining protein MreC [Patescibacteria group bacterium]MBU2233596.1 rod shape-determining protein MreC [Patescibacteria group bacterium]